MYVILPCNHVVCLLRLRGLAENFVKCNVANGQTASFWFDNWTPFGPLIKYLGEDGPRSLRVRINAKVRDVCNRNGWTMAAPRSEQALNLQIHLTDIRNPNESNEEDAYEWVIEGKSCQGYSSAKTWSVLRPRAEEVTWYSSVWFKGAIPRNAFNMWITNLDRLPTKTRLARWGVNVNPICDLCQTHQESRDHLFLTCDYALYLWNAVSLRLSLPSIRFQNWSELIAWTRTKNSTSPSTLRKLVAEAVIYALWKQRNNVVYNQVHILPSLQFRDIDREIKNSITARRIKKSFRTLMARWLRKD